MQNKYTVEGTVVTMEVQGQQAIFDLECFHAVDRFGSWKLARGTSISTDFRHEGKMCKITLHKLLTGSKFVKWLNGNTFDFRRENMEAIEKSIRPRPCGVYVKGNEFRIEGDDIVLRVCTKTEELETYIDAEDYLLASGYTWCVNPVSGYVQTKTREGAKFSKGIYLHRLIMDVEGFHIKVDHVNGERLDNRKENLRVCGNSANMHNTHKHRGVGVGVSRTLNGEWRTQMQVEGVRHDKTFVDFDDAVAQYKAWRDEYNPSGLGEVCPQS